MKKTILILATAFLITGAQAQDNAINKYFSQYLSDTSFTKVTVTSKMFSLFADIDPEDEAEKEIMEAMSKLKGIKALVNEEPANAAALYDDAVKKVSGNKDYEELLSVEDADENVRFMIKDKSGVINELLMVIGGKKEFMVLSLYGEIDLKQIAKLSRVMDMKGIDKLKALDKGND